MSYQAIARKWRPTTFEEIAGQTHVTRTLANAIKLGRVHHAFLFSGPRGVGKTTVARALARCLNCAQGPTESPCGECPSCIEILAGSSPDVMEIDGASNNSVDDIRDLREGVRYMPVHGKSKVYIVDEVHMLSKGAFNALLKTLEEPPAHVVFMFATTEPQRIPDTILSRVQRFDFKRIPMDVVVGRLQTICAAESVQIGEDALRLVARAGEGSMRDAQSLLDQVISFAGESPTIEQVADILGLVDRSLLYQMLTGMVKGDADACLEAIAAVYGYGYELSEFTSELLELLRNATLVGLSPGSRKYLDVPEDERGRLEDLVRDVSPDVLVRAFQVMLDVHDQVARSGRPRLVLEMAVARLVSIRPAQPIDRLLARMTDLEQRIRDGGGRVSAPRAPRAATTASAAPAEEPEPEPEPALEPEPEPEPAVALDSAPTESAEPEPAVALDSAPTQIAEPEPVAALDSGPTQIAEPEPVAVLDAAPTQISEPEPEPVAEPVSVETVSPGPSLFENSPTVVAEPPAAPEVSEDLPDPLPADATSAERFAHFRAWLGTGSIRYDVWEEDTALVSTSDGVLRIACPTIFKRKLADQMRKDERVAAGMRICFPDCNRLELIERDDQSNQQTSREIKAEDARIRQAEIEAEVEAHADVGAVREALSATITGVHGCPESALPPPLDPEAQL